MILFTTGDILGLLDQKVPPNTFDNWCRDKLVTPVSGGTGTGNHRQWSFSQAVGFLLAQQARESQRGCALSFVGEVVKTFGNVNETWLKERLAKGQRYCVYLQQRPVLSSDARSGWDLDVQSAFDRVTKFAAKK